MEVNQGEEEKLDIFQTKCLRRIFKIRWQQHVSNATVLELAGAGKISEEVRRKRWNWIGHVLRKEPTNDCAVALGWTPEGRRKSGRPKTTWRRMVEVERKQCRLEFLEYGTPCSLKPTQMEERCPGLVCLLALREIINNLLPSEESTGDKDPK